MDFQVLKDISMKIPILLRQKEKLAVKLFGIFEDEFN